MLAGRGLLALLFLAALLLSLLPALLLGVRGALLLVLGLASNNNEDKLLEEEVQVQVQCFRTEPGPAPTLLYKACHHYYYLVSWVTWHCSCCSTQHSSTYSVLHCCWGSLRHTCAQGFTLKKSNV